MACMLRKSLRGLLAARSRASAARNSTAGTSTRYFCEAKLPKPVAEAPLEKSDRWIEVHSESQAAHAMRCCVRIATH